MKKIAKNIIMVLIPIIILSQFAISSYYYNKYKNISQEYNNVVELEKTCNSQLGQYKTNITEKDNIISNLEEQVNSLTTELNTLKEFKNGIEKEKKQEMIDSFYMLSDEDKKDVLENIDTYSLDDIEAKLSIICVRNKVSFNLDNEVDPPAGPTTFNLDDPADDTTPAWVKAALQTAQNM